MPLHEYKVFFIFLAETQHTLNYRLLMFLIFEFCYHSLCCDPENRFLMKCFFSKKYPNSILQKKAEAEMVSFVPFKHSDTSSDDAPEETAFLMESLIAC